MPILRKRRRLIIQRKTVKAILVGLVIGLIYFAYLGIENQRAERYYANLRKTDPVRYLDDLRRTEGFDSYLDKFRLLEGYNKFQVAVPPFLVGRWNMKSKPQRVAPRTTITDCSDSITFEQGLIELTIKGKKMQHKVKYSIAGSDIYLRGIKTGLLKIGMVIYGNSIDHLEFVPPGRESKVYAYFCGS